MLLRSGRSGRAAPRPAAGHSKLPDKHASVHIEPPKKKSIDAYKNNCAGVGTGLGVGCGGRGVSTKVVNNVKAASGMNVGTM